MVHEDHVLPDPTLILVWRPTIVAVEAHVVLLSTHDQVEAFPTTRLVRAKNSMITQIVLHNSRRKKLIISGHTTGMININLRNGTLAWVVQQVLTFFIHANGCPRF